MGYALLVGALLLCLGPILARPQGTLRSPGNPDYKQLRAIEDSVAEKIIQIRKNEGLEKLNRVYRREARELACSVAVHPSHRMGPGAAGFLEFEMYTSDNPNDESMFKYIARYPPTRLEYDKFSVAAWPARDPSAPSGSYGIAIVLFTRTGSNFFGKFLTDGINVRNDWKKMVAPECQNLK